MSHLPTPPPSKVLASPPEDRSPPAGGAPGPEQGASEGMQIESLRDEERALMVGVMTEAPNDRLKPLVLLVDDYVDTLEALEEFLKDRGFDVLTAADGGAALDMAREYLPDVMLLDMQLPVFTGIEVARMLKSDASTSNIAIIAFTANMYEYLMEEAIGAGCTSYLTKPAGPDTIEKEIWRVLARA